MYLNPVIVLYCAGVIWLTLTWDVFKYVKQYNPNDIQPRLTLTWDVFKLQNPFIALLPHPRLTLTWDVFK